MIKPENYISVQGWMCLDPEVGGLGLKGNDLVIYAIIYGFAQTEGQCFCGSLNYLQEWTRSTRAGVIKNLNNLIEMGLIRKVECSPTNHYYITKFNPIKELKNNLNDVNKVEEDVNSVNDDVNSVNETCIQSKHNNIVNKSNNINNKYKEQVELNNKVEEIISYFNHICSSNFRSTTSSTKKLIKARLGEGFTIDDFKKVIDVKYNDWGKTPVKFNNGQWSNEYLRPSTLFSDKFESYIYEANTRAKGITPKFNSTSVEVNEVKSDLTF